MRLTVTVLAPLLAAATAMAQDVPVPAVTPANPGVYANPLKLDTDKYKNSTQARRASAPFGLCHDQPLTQARRAALERGYLFRAKGNERQAYRWLRDPCGTNAARTLSRAAQRAEAKR